MNEKSKATYPGAKIADCHFVENRPQPDPDSKTVGCEQVHHQPATAPQSRQARLSSQAGPGLCGRAALRCPRPYPTANLASGRTAAKRKVEPTTDKPLARGQRGAARKSREDLPIRQRRQNPRRKSPRIPSLSEKAQETLRSSLVPRTYQKRVCIDQCPDVVDKRLRTGDWEADTLIRRKGGKVLGRTQVSLLHDHGF